MKIGVIMIGAALLGGCSGSPSPAGAGATVPAQFLGTWGADCASPFVQFAAGTAKVFPDNATYILKDAKLRGTDLSVTYERASATITDVYVADGDTLRLDRTKSGNQEATWHKAPMSKCR